MNVVLPSDAKDLKSKDLDPRETKRVLLEIHEKRMRQISTHGYRRSHDDKHVNGEIAQAAIPYIQGAYANELGLTDEELQVFWPWDGTVDLSQGRRELILNAAALLVAELERLDRAGGRS